MERHVLMQRLDELKKKQKMIDRAWEKSANRKLLEFFVELIPKALKVERCSIFILDPKEDNVWVHCGTGIEEKQISVPTWSSMVGNVISSGEWQMEMDMEQLVGAHDTVDVKTGFISRNALCVPVHGVTTDQVTGAIQVLNKQGDLPFVEEDREILEKLAFHLQMNIENLYLRQEMAKVSYEMGKAIKRMEQKLQKSAL